MNVYQTIPPYNLSWMKSRTFFNQILKEEAINLIDIGARNTSCEELEPLKNCLNYIMDGDTDEAFEYLAESLKNLLNNHKLKKYSLDNFIQSKSLFSIFL